jgi:exopolyphosphatase/guanosine-5'-triphosphate,3'-diphosphate pyrophosphatase
MNSEPVAAPETAPADNKTPAALPAKTVAVIDIGATAIRMEIAEIRTDGSVRTIDALHKAVGLGKDTFTTNRIQQSTIEECVGVLKGFRKTMEEYGVTEAKQIRAVATSSVREAINRDTFLDRIYMATRINVEPIEEAEETRLTYLAVQHVLKSETDLQKADALIVEVGGGDSEVLLMQDGHVTFSHTFRLGSLRMKETLETHRAPAQRIPAIMAKHIQLTIDQMKRSIPLSKVPYLIAVSGDARFAAAQLASKWTELPYARLDVKAFLQLAKKIAPLSADDLVRKYQINYQEAETLGTALTSYAQIAKVFEVEHIVVPKTSLRHGLVQEFVEGGSWSKDYITQVIHSAMAIGYKYAFDEKHASQVAELSTRLFRELQPEHQLAPRYEVILHVAAILHEIGSFISNRSHHKHSMYLILNSDLFGLSRHDLTLVALVARYHRRAMPQPYHEVYSTLNRDDRLAVNKMAAVLRVADALDRNHMQQARDFTYSREKGLFIIHVKGVDDLTLERAALKDKGSMFEEIYGLKVAFRGVSTTENLSPDI